MTTESEARALCLMLNICKSDKHFGGRVERNKRGRDTKSDVHSLSGDLLGGYFALCKLRVASSLCGLSVIVKRMSSV